jgi:hypothetical protein
MGRDRPLFDAKEQEGRGATRHLTMVSPPPTSTYQCSPALHRRAGQSCLPPDALRRIERAWRRAQGRASAQGGTRSGSGARGKGRAGTRRSRGRAAEAAECATEYCLVRRAPNVPRTTRKALLERYFRPAAPSTWRKKPHEWLDSVNLADVMEQYEDADPTFSFVGPVPSDWDADAGAPGSSPAASVGRCVSRELCALNLADVRARGIRKIGVIFNLDTHTQPGSHWTSVYVDLNRNAAYYYDSYGMAPPPRIARFLAALRAQGVAHVQHNTVRAQYGNSECGVYSLYVLICLLRGKPWEAVVAARPPDSVLNRMRDMLFVSDRAPRAAAFDAAAQLCT